MIRTVFFLALCFTQGYTNNIIVETNSQQLTQLRGIYSQVNPNILSYRTAAGYQILARTSGQARKVFFADNHGREIGYLLDLHGRPPAGLTNFPPMLNKVFNVHVTPVNVVGQVTLSTIVA